MIYGAVLDLFRGRAVTIPPMDGALRPNTALDEAEAIAEADAPDNLAFDGRRLLYSAGNLLLARTLGSDTAEEVARFDQAVTALAVSPDGTLAVGLDDGSIRLGNRTLGPANFGGSACATALAFADPRTLLVAQGSAEHRASDWVVDLMSQGASGSVWRADLHGSSAPARLGGGLAFPYGVLADGERVVVAESWRHRLVSLPLSGGTPREILRKLPGYPSRLSPAKDGGAWLALFAPRNRLIEFILQETHYRADMMRELPREHWIAPALASGVSFLEPLQCGGVVTMGIHKPWSPTRSYGLGVRLDRDMRPVASYHSRAGGTRHGITSVIDAGGSTIAAAKGGNVILRLRLNGTAP